MVDRQTSSLAAAVVAGLATLGLGGCTSTQSDLQAVIQKAVSKSPETAVLTLGNNTAPVETAVGTKLHHVVAVVPAGKESPATNQALQALSKAGWLTVKRGKAWPEGSLAGTDYIMAPSGSGQAQARFAHARKALKKVADHAVWERISTANQQLYAKGVVKHDGRVTPTTPVVKNFYVAYQAGSYRTPETRAVLKALVKHGYLTEHRVSHVYLEGTGAPLVEHLAHHRPWVHPEAFDVYFETAKGKPFLGHNKRGDPMVELATAHFAKVLRAQPAVMSSHWNVDFLRHVESTPLASMGAVKKAVKEEHFGSYPTVSGRQVLEATFESAHLKHRIGNLEDVTSGYAKPKRITVYTTTSAGRKHLIGSMLGGQQAVVGRWVPSSVTNYSKPSKKYDGDLMADVTFTFKSNLSKSTRQALAALAVKGQSVPAAGAKRKEECLLMPMHKGYKFDGCRPTQG